VLGLELPPARDFESKGFGLPPKEGLDPYAGLDFEPKAAFGFEAKSDFGFAPNGGFDLELNPDFGFELFGFQVPLPELGLEAPVQSFHMR